MEQPLISVIIPTFNRAQQAIECVRSVLATGYANMEVVVVDDCSPDTTVEKVREAFKGNLIVKCVRNEKNRQLAGARNRGAAESSGRWIFFLDDDNIVHKDIFTEFERSISRHPDAAFIAPLAIQKRKGNENEIWTIGSDFNRWTSQPKDRSPHLLLNDLPTGVSEFSTTYSPNAFLVRRDAFKQVGGCDESFGIMFDESDFGWRIMEAGYELFISAGARTDHRGFVEAGCVSQLRYLGIEKPYRTYLFARNRLKFARKHFNFLQVLSVMFVFAPLSCGYYGLVALRNRRPDIAWAYLRGTLAGIFGFY